MRSPRESLLRPLQQRLLTVADSAPLRGPLWRLFYEWLATQQADVFAVMNFGYADLDARAGEPSDAFGLRLYDEVVGTRLRRNPPSGWEKNSRDDH